MIHLKREKEFVEKYLKARKWLHPKETIEGLEKPGDGNMNFTLRVKTNLRSFIIKQSRDYVEKYPSVSAPETRALREAEFYKLIGSNEYLKSMMPNLLQVDPNNNVLMMDDLGAGVDFTYLYRATGKLSKSKIDVLTSFLVELHSSITRENSPTYISNKKMRKLNHEHIFIYPYLADNGLDLDNILPGLKAVGEAVKGNTRLQTVLREVGKIYLSDGEYLLHGDYFPGSWLKTTDGIKIIDPEFCFFGPVEYEIGVMIAHLKLADQPREVIEYALRKYADQLAFDIVLQQQFTGAEILRRILGLAQLPLSIGLEKRKNLVEEAMEGVLGSKADSQ